MLGNKTGQNELKILTRGSDLYVLIISSMRITRVREPYFKSTFNLNFISAKKLKDGVILSVVSCAMVRLY